MEAAQLETHRWWKEGVCYQVWPLSFKDSNGDGNGDIRGLISKLDYLKHLGVDYVWMSPAYKSPRHDYGYDIADYESVDPTFGSLQDMDDLIAGLKARGMRLILDLVVNHTSSEHRWFKESAKSRDNKYSNYYIWRDPKIVDGKKCPPNNWRAFFGGGSAWVYVEARDQYYLRLFLETMPDLNWEDETVRWAIYESAIEFWLKRGVAGFRVDVVCIYSKDITFPDAPITDPDQEFQRPAVEMVAHGPREHEWLQEQRQQVLNKYGEDVMLVGELGSAPIEHMRKYLSPVARELDIVFDFEIFKAGGPQDPKPMGEWKDNRCLVELRKGLMVSQSFMSELGAWATSYFENHDQPRSIPTFGSRDPKHYWQSGKLLALILSSMSGTLFIYQGQEIGMNNIPKEWDRSELKDPAWLQFLEGAETQYADDHEKLSVAKDFFQRNLRDHARTPVQWSAEEPYAGFSTVQPWMRVNESFREGINVEDQLAKPDSLLNFWREVLKFRKAHTETMIYGHTKFIDNDNEHIFSVVKQESTASGVGQKSVLVVMNYSDDVRPLPVLNQSELEGEVGGFLFGTGPSSDTSDLQPWEGRVFELKKIHNLN